MTWSPPPLAVPLGVALYLQGLPEESGAHQGSWRYNPPNRFLLHARLVSLVPAEESRLPCCGMPAEDTMPQWPQPGQTNNRLDSARIPASPVMPPSHGGRISGSRDVGIRVITRYMGNSVRLFG